MKKPQEKPYTPPPLNILDVIHYNWAYYILVMHKHGLHGYN